MTEIIIQNAVQIVATLLITLIGVLGAWLTAKIAKRTELHNISSATDAVITAAQLTVLELQQTVVEGWKAASTDGKLSDDEIKQLGNMLIQKTVEKMADSTKDLLNAAGVDITAIITGAGEAMIQTMKR
mgnify:CR=1 FL=1